MKKIRLLIVLIVLAITIMIAMQTANAQRILTYGEYINKVREKNIEYIVEKYEVSIAEANVQAAKVFPDPELSMSYEDYQDWDLQTGRAFSAELGYTLELGGKRRARMAIAKSEQQMRESLVEDFFRNLQADATLCYLETIMQKQITTLVLSSYQSMRDLAHNDSLRFALGEIAEVDAMQTRLEATTMMSVYLQTEVTYKNMLSDLVVFEGGGTAIDSVAGSLSLIFRPYQLSELIETAEDNRADLRAAVSGKELSVANTRLVKANRVIDLGLNVGFASLIERNMEGEVPGFRHVSAGISIPLKFSNTNKGALRAAQISERQAASQYDAILLQIRKEVEQSYNNYLTAYRQAALYQAATLTDATLIFEKKKYSYARGETSLLEVLNAQRTANEVFQNYYEALYNANASLVELCRVVGIWDINL